MRSGIAGNRRGDADNSVVATDDPSEPCPTPADDRDLPDDTAVVDDPDAPTAAIRERAREALVVACDGWRARRRCTAPDGTRVVHPHPECLAAQYRHDLILLENGVPR
jgi:hypothetical protein